VYRLPGICFSAATDVVLGMIEQGRDPVSSRADSMAAETLSSIIPSVIHSTQRMAWHITHIARLECHYRCDRMKEKKENESQPEKLKSREQVSSVEKRPLV